MGRCYELAGDLTLLYLQGQDKNQQQLVSAQSTTGGGLFPLTWFTSYFRGRACYFPTIYAPPLL